MLGAIIGDIIGSVYELNNIKTKEFPLFSEGCSFTDDTVLTVAIAEALMDYGFYRAVEDSDGARFAQSLKKWAMKYPEMGYGKRFDNWVFTDSNKPYDSWGNGAAVRASPCGWFVPFYDIKDDHNFGMKMSFRFTATERIARMAAEVTHNHAEGIKGAEAVAISIMHLRVGRWLGHSIEDCKKTIRRSVASNLGYDLSRTLDEIRRDYTFDSSCQGIVPEAIIAFLESTGF
jgi:ADP-ribosylglycohydrolase